MRLFKINTTAYEEEDFFLFTDLSEDDITEVIYPIVMAERNGNEEYDSEIILSLLRKKYPHKKITMIVELHHLAY